VDPRLSEQEKARRYPAQPYYSDEHSGIYADFEDVTCFAEIDTSATVQKRKLSGRPYFSDPSTFVWVPGPGKAGPMSTRWDSAIDKLLFPQVRGGIQLYVRTASRDGWLDLGRVSKCRVHYIGPTRETMQLLDVGFRLRGMLSEPLWLEFGSRPGWSLFVNYEEVETMTPSDVIEAVRAAWNAPRVLLELTRYTGEYIMAVADDAGWAALDYNAINQTFETRAAEPNPDADEYYIFLPPSNYDFEFRKERIVPRTELISILENLLRTGIPLGLVRWTCPTEPSQGESEPA